MGWELYRITEARLHSKSAKFELPLPQVQRLEEAYQQKRYLTRRERKELAKEADISHTQVKIWFQNRRAKAKLKVNTATIFRKFPLHYELIRVLKAPSSYSSVNEKITSFTGCGMQWRQAI